MFHPKDIRRHNVSSSPYLPSRALDSPTVPVYDPTNDPAHDNPIPTTPSTPPSHEDPEVEDVLAPGDIVGKGSLLKGDVVSLLPSDNDEDEDEQFHVIKELGKGSYAVVYLVHQVPRGAAPSRPRSNTADSSEDGHILGHMDSEEPLAKPAHQPAKTYGRQFAIKCLSKANLDKEGLGIQMTEVPFLSLPSVLSLTLDTGNDPSISPSAPKYSCTAQNPPNIVLPPPCARIRTRRRSILLPATSKRPLSVLSPRELLSGITSRTTANPTDTLASLKLQPVSSPLPLTVAPYRIHVWPDVRCRRDLSCCWRFS